jgi:hypothetical protein
MFSEIDDFYKWFAPLYTHRLLQNAQHTRQTALALSKIMTIASKRQGAVFRCMAGLGCRPTWTLGMGMWPSKVFQS